jgi:hypothetical protein
VPRKKQSVPSLPRRVTARAGGRVVAEIAFGPGGEIVPGSVLLRCDPAGVSGPDRERCVAGVVREAGLDPKEDHERIYAVLFGGSP